MRQISRHPGPDESPVPSPDSSRIAWIAREPKAQSYLVGKLTVANADGSRLRVLAGTLDREPTQSAVEQRFAHGLLHGGRSRRDARVRGAQRRLGARGDAGEPQRLRGFTLADNGRAAAVRSHGGGVRRTDYVPGGSAGEAGATRRRQCRAAGRARCRRGGSARVGVRRQDDTGLGGQAAGLRRVEEVPAPGGCGRCAAAHVRRPSSGCAHRSSRHAGSSCCAPIRAARRGTARSSAA